MPPMPHWLTVTGSVIDGRACRTRAALFTEAARVLRFPEYFGHNWDAFADCLRDLPEPAVLVVTTADELLAEEDAAQLAVLLDVLAGSGLTVTFCTLPSGESALETRLGLAPPA